MNKFEFAEQLIAIVKRDVAPALGCTEPISLALAAAIAKSYLGGEPVQIQAKVSPNLMKNGMGVTVPGTGMVGLPIAAAVGAIAGDAEAGLEVLKHIQAEAVAKAKAMLDTNQVSVDIANVDFPLYSEALLLGETGWVKVCIQDTHTNVVLIEKNGEVLFQQQTQAVETADDYHFFNQLSAEQIYQFAMEVPLEQIAFIAEAAKLNSALSKEGLEKEYGLHIGRTLKKQIELGLMSDDLLSRIVIETTAASDARMGGVLLPAMSNSGSGNQGIAATMPSVIVARFVNADDEQLIRALFLSHTIAIYIHSKLPKLSALCAVTTAAMSSAAGMAYLLKGNFNAISMAICSMIGDISGVLCDGAANSCAMKVSTGVSSAYKAVLMALDNSRVTGNEGIVEHSVDKSINNLCAIATKSMVYMDRQIIEIMSTKEQDC
ncbi:L-serine ammonia-lyase, iron-sulfur-dependent, subunit alpha [Glaesserella parasuis]|nr:L-serine ammonia-lyase, iron-sulfur-dependent, subunit alpha [Glaesserella parasuis]MCT8669617.1 L-serine ammonia-lyase, iron-sulfur-dependent, subunit alpha [Glaesserella parasuis]MCT8681232.1 L-serine ammonia-lyase, iron-sulfur-dependent, subunit alpha [Glaesserella parasuis]